MEKERQSIFKTEREREIVEECGGMVSLTVALPKECISHILSLTSPRDVCRSILVSYEFQSAAESDTVWAKFLPADLTKIISRSTTPLVLSSKRDLYFHLCSSPVLLDGGTKSFALVKTTGKKCYMLGARELSIAWGDTPRYWDWISIPESRFAEVARLRVVYWLDIRGRVETRELSPDTTYAAYFVYKGVENSHTFQRNPVRISINFVEEEEEGESEAEVDYETAYLVSSQNGENPRDRGDGWKEIKLGEFFNGRDDCKVEMKLREIQVLNSKSGLVVEGIELRPEE